MHIIDYNGIEKASPPSTTQVAWNSHNKSSSPKHAITSF